jgi:hypothetical protein
MRPQNNILLYFIDSMPSKQHRNSSKNKRKSYRSGGSNLVDLAIPAAFVYANNNFSKGTMLSAPKKMLRNTMKSISPFSRGRRSSSRRRRFSRRL